MFIPYFIGLLSKKVLPKLGDSEKRYKVWANHVEGFLRKVDWNLLHIIFTGTTLKYLVWETELAGIKDVTEYKMSMLVTS